MHCFKQQVGGGGGGSIAIAEGIIRIKEFIILLHQCMRVGFVLKKFQIHIYMYMYNK